MTVDDFIEATEFERLALDRYLPLFGDEPGDTWDFREAIVGSGPVNLRVEFIADVRRTDEGLRAALLPLVFGAAWKVLDLLMELALAHAGYQPDLARGWSIAEKGRLAKQGRGESALLGVEPQTWKAIGRLYAATAEHRHCLVHRTASFSVQPIQLTGASRHGPLLPLDQRELHAFIHLAQLVADGVRDGGLSRRSVDYLHLCLQRLERHSGVMVAEGVLLQSPLKALMALKVDEEGRWVADFAYLHEQLARRAPKQHVDVWIEIPGEASHSLFGHLDDIPRQAALLDLARLPGYLERR